MGVAPATFTSGGLQSQHYLPGAYSRISFLKGTGGLVSAANAVIFGDCRGGEPNIIHWFGSPAIAEEILRSGPLLDAVKHAFKVGGGLVPQQIGALRVNPGIRATREFKNSSDNMIDAYGWDWGLHTNQLKSKLEAGTINGKKLTLKFQNNDDEIVDDIYRESFEIEYTGAGSAATMTISLTQLTTTCTGAPTDDLTIAFASFPTIEDIVNYINDQTGYTCTILTPVPAQKSEHLDSITAQDIKTSAYTAQSTLQAIIDTLNVSPWIDEALLDSGATSRLIPDNDTGWVYFGEAVDGSYTSTEWGVSLTLAEQEDIQVIGSSSEDEAIHALIKTHCVSMNSVTGKAERQYVLGGALGETVAQAKTRAYNLGSEAGLLAYPGIKDYDFDNLSVVKTWSPVYYAAKILGAQVALALNEPFTFKDVDILGWEKNLTIPEAEDLIKNGVCPGIKHKSGRLICARTITTYQGDKLQMNEFSMMRESLFVSRDLREAVENSFVGKAMSNSLLGKVDGIAIGKLSQYYDLGLFNGIPPYWGYKKTIVGDRVKVEYDCNLTPPTNFVFITSHMHVYASTGG